MQTGELVYSTRDIICDGNEIDKPCAVFKGEKGIIKAQIRKRVYVVSFAVGDFICFSHEIDSVTARETRRFALFCLLYIAGTIAVLCAVQHL